MEERSRLTITTPAPKPDQGINKVFLQQALGSILRKRGYAASTDPCFRFLDQLQKSCDDSNSTVTKRDCFISCGKLVMLNQMEFGLGLLSYFSCVQTLKLHFSRRKP